MNNQLSLFQQNEAEKRVFTRVKSGRFATKEQKRIEAIERENERYKLLYEAERRKNKPLTDMVVRLSHELEEIKKQCQIFSFQNTNK